MKFPKLNSPLAALKNSVKTQIEGVKQTADNLREAKSLYDDYKNFDFENSDPTQFVNRLDKLVENSIDNDKTLNLIKMRDPEIYNKIIENREYIKETAKLPVEEQIRRAKEFYEQNQGLGSKVANEVIPEAKIEVSETIKPTVEPKVVETVETVKEELPKSIEIQKDVVPETTQVASTSSEVSNIIPDTSSVSIPEVAKNYSLFDFNKNGKISDDLLKVGLGVAGAAALGYAGHKLYKHFKNKRKDMSEYSEDKKLNEYFSWKDSKTYDRNFVPKIFKSYSFNKSKSNRLDNNNVLWMNSSYEEFKDDVPRFYVQHGYSGSSPDIKKAFDQLKRVKSRNNYIDEENQRFLPVPKGYVPRYLDDDDSIAYFIRDIKNRPRTNYTVKDVKDAWNSLPIKSKQSFLSDDISKNDEYLLDWAPLYNDQDLYQDILEESRKFKKNDMSEQSLGKLAAYIIIDTR